MWSLYTERVEDVSQRADMEQKAQVAMLSLLFQQGVSPNWYEVSNFSIIGLSEGDYVLDVDLVNGLQTRNDSYRNVSDALGVRGYELFVDVRNDTGQLYSFGVAVPTTAVQVVRLDRVAWMDGRPVTLTLEVWDNE